MVLNGGEGLLFNTKKAPFDDPELRKALAYAIKPEDFNNAVYNGHAAVGGNLFSQDSPWYDASAAPPAYDPEKATKIFEAYEAAHGSPLQFTYNSFQSASSQAVGQYLQAALGEYGVEVEVDVADAATAATKVYSGEFDVSNWGLTIGGEPEPDLSQFFLGGLPGNLSGIADPSLDEALTLAASTTDADRARGGVRRRAARVLRRAPVPAAEPAGRGPPLLHRTSAAFGSRPTGR